jgi:hypothetical protein
MKDTTPPKVDRPSASGTDDRRPYQKPKIAWEERLDSPVGLAMACARAVLQDPQCAAGGLAS